SMDLIGGVSFLAVMIGTAALAEVLYQMDGGDKNEVMEKFEVNDMSLTRAELRQMVKPTIIGCIFGVFIGIMPAAGANI
ncbi:MAG: tripartite tricarboxylate transporter permease, partial [Deltaproteobacteria bacterium]|nr:tripartite tricarboxylate transporter permease [Deltaproteobacteria bacterium]